MSEKLTLFPVPSSRMSEVWPLAKNLIRDALEYADNKFALEDIFFHLRHMDMQLWLVIDELDAIKGAIVTQIIQYPNKKVLLIMLISGVKFDDWSHFLSDFIAFAKDHNCQSLEGYGRAGWEKKIKHLGFKKIHTIFSLPI